MGAFFKIALEALSTVKNIGGWFKARKVRKKEELEFDAKHKTANYFDKYDVDEF